MRVYIFRNDGEGLYAYTDDPEGKDLPAPISGMAWVKCGFIADLHRAFTADRAQAIRDVMQARGFYLFKPSQ